MRIGHGYDVHKFSEQVQIEGCIRLGGVDIPHEHSLIAHSDGDVLLHAVCDALLGAAALGDIGHHFPDNDEQFRGADSRQLLKSVYKMVQGNQYRISNMDITIIAQAPKMAPHIASMINVLCEDLFIAPQQVNIKATTTEGLGYIGRKEGIAVHAVVLLV